VVERVPAQLMVVPEQRGRGLGSAVLEALLMHASGRGGGTVWCHARIAARTLYERRGFRAEGAPFDDPVAGRQVLMVTEIGP
jgi:GNAT superfamily N-acetyltransferase